MLEGGGRPNLAPASDRNVWQTHVGKQFPIEPIKNLQKRPWRKWIAFFLVKKWVNIAQAKDHLITNAE